MAALALGISGRLEEGETLQAWVLGSGALVQWQALVNGSWVNVGNGASLSFVIPPGAAGAMYRVAAAGAAGPVYSTATPVVTLDTKKAAAPVLSGGDPINLALENGSLPGIFSWLTFSDADRANYGGGSLLLQDSNSILYGGDGHDLLSIRFAGTGAGQFSYNAATREVRYAFTAGTATVIGTVDAALNGNGTDLKIVFNANATTTVVDALINNLQFANNDDSPVLDRLLTLRVTDPTGASAQRVTSVAVDARADAPVFTSAASFALDENQAAAGTVAAIDPDREAGAPQGIGYSLAAGQGDGDNALFEIDAATGALRFKAAPDFESSTHGPQYSVRVRATDSEGSVAEQAIAVTVRNVNDAPVVADVHATARENGGAVRIDPLFTDPDAQETWTLGIGTTGTVGSVVLEAGHFIYNPAGRFESLAAGGPVAHDSFSYTVTDSAGHAVTRTVFVDVSGENDAPVAAGPSTGTIIEAGAGVGGSFIIQGNALATDVDAGDVLSWSGGPVQGIYGNFGIGTDGHWSYRLNDDREVTQALAQGQFATETFNVTVRDAAGAAAQTQVIVTVQGTNDAPMVSPSGGVGGPPTVHEPDQTGRLRLDLGGNEGDAVIAVDAAGRVIVLGTAQDPQTGFGGPVLARFLDDGTPDAAFGDGGRSSFAGTFVPKGVAVDAAGGLFCVGYSWDAYSQDRTDWCIQRFDAAGQLDTAFGNGGRLAIDFGHGYDYGESVTVLANGQLLVTGTASGTSSMRVAVRLNADGSMDAGFGAAGVMQFAGEPADARITVDGQGRILVWGSTEDASGVVHLTVGRYLADGTLDAGFGDGGHADIPAGILHDGSTLVVGTDGRIALGWSEYTGELNRYPLHLAMLTADGVLDASFSGDGLAADPYHSMDALRLAFDATGRLLVAYDDPAGDLWLMRFNANGAFDTSFNGGSLVFNGGIPVKADFGGDEVLAGLHVAADGSIVVSGATWLNGAQDVVLAGFNNAGSVDLHFGSPVQGSVSISGHVGATDPDAGDVLQWSGSANGTYGQLIIDAAGAWTYTLDAQRAATQALQEGQVVSDAFTVTVTDNHGASASTGVAITIIGSSDVPQA